MRLLSLIIAGGVAAVLVASEPSPAHHGFSGRYDISQPIWLEGQVTRAYFGQPHPEVSLRIGAELAPPATAPDVAEAGDVIAAGALSVRPDTVGREVKVEFPPIRAFLNLGPSITIGDRVAVIAFRNCEAPHQLRGQWTRPANGAPITRSGLVQYQVQGC